MDGYSMGSINVWWTVGLRRVSGSRNLKIIAGNKQKLSGLGTGSGSEKTNDMRWHTNLI